MASGRLFAGSAVVLGLVAVGHAIVTWPVAPTLALFGGGAFLAFVAEALVVSLDWLEHHIGPTVAGVPLYVLFGWTGIIYLAVRVAQLVTDGWAVILVTGVLASAYDLLTDYHGVEAGHWTYTDAVAGPRYRGVPWWNYAGWFAISSLTASVTLPLL